MNGVSGNLPWLEWGQKLPTSSHLVPGNINVQQLAKGFGADSYDWVVTEIRPVVGDGWEKGVSLRMDSNRAKETIATVYGNDRGKTRPPLYVVVHRH